jgi:hypothetical protein
MQQFLLKLQHFDGVSCNLGLKLVNPACQALAWILTKNRMTACGRLNQNFQDERMYRMNAEMLWA